MTLLWVKGSIIQYQKKLKHQLPGNRLRID